MEDGPECRLFFYNPSYLIFFLVPLEDGPECSVGNPDPEPDPDPHVFGPHGSGFISQRYGFPFHIRVLSGLKLCLQNKF